MKCVMRKKNGIRPIDANALLDAMPKSTVLLRHQVVDLICNSPSIDIVSVALVFFGAMEALFLLEKATGGIICVLCMLGCVYGAAGLGGNGDI